MKSRNCAKTNFTSFMVSLGILGGMLRLTASAQVQDFEDALLAPTVTSLKTEPVPQSANLNEFIADRGAALILGKALFWDMQVGSDGVTTCATCHFHAGADSRSVNTLSPAQLSAVRSDHSASSTFSKRGVNVRLNPRDFPFHRLADADNRHSARISESDSIVGSQGVLLELFGQVLPRRSDELRSTVRDSVFSKSGTNTRRVTPRNTPSVINAVFNLRNFWDGRAQDVFNGVNAFGSRDAGARVMRADHPSSMFPTVVRLRHSSLASQAVAPPLSDIEMSADGRAFPDLGKKLLGLRPLALQEVSPTDSVFAGLTHKSGRGLVYANYFELVRRAFHPRWWQGGQWIELVSGGRPSLVSAPSSAKSNLYSHASWNFALIFGLALQVYESTLISDDSPFDRFAEGNQQALNAQQIEGMGLFFGKAHCAACHNGPEFTNASVSRVSQERIEQMIFASGLPVPDASGFINTTGRRVVYDNGFYNIGVRPTREDLALGQVDPFGYPLSEARLFYEGKLGELGLPMPAFSLEKNRIPSADGAFKTPSLRNVELTAPYFHNGGTLTLRQVMDFYNRGGDFKEENRADIPPDITELGLTPVEKDQLVAFMRALTDDRVRFHKAPFDHPQLMVPNGHLVDAQGAIQKDSNGRSMNHWITIPAAGRQGFRALPNFPNLP
jgi:cytochrome c peroxidase